MSRHNARSCKLQKGKWDSNIVEPMLLYPQPTWTWCWSYEGGPCIHLDYRRVGDTDIKQVIATNYEDDKPFPPDLKSSGERRHAKIEQR